MGTRLSLKELKQRRMTDLRALRVMGRWSLVVRLGTVGAFAGLAAWTMILTAHQLFDVTRPSGIALLLAIVRGAAVGTILALALWWYWNRPRGQRESKERL
jgi:hypothetical protein